ncbi:helix-turn-helix domain-containing protein [Streptomyces albidoflavus]
MSNLVQMPERRPVNQRVGMNVHLIMMMRGKTQMELARVLGVTQSSASRRLSGLSPWTPDELEATAEFLNVSVGRLFEELPHLDSNQEPIG